MSNVRSITPLPPADFTPEVGNYKTLQPFRYWCQKVLPLVYDDSLSYYELLCKVVDYLNKTMEDVETLHGDVTNLHTAYEELQSYVNSYFSSIDVQEEINNKLDNMAESGELYEIIRRYTDPIVNEQNEKINVLKSRMDTFSSLPDGSTSGDAELTDIRVGYNGHVYPNAGDAVREQVGDIVDLNGVSTQDIVWSNGYIINSDGTVSRVDDSTSWKISSDIIVKKNQKIILHHGIAYNNGNIVAIAKKNNDGTYSSLVQGDSKLVDYTYIATEDCVLVLTAYYTSTKKVVIGYSTKDALDKAEELNRKTSKKIIVSAFDASDEWKEKAVYKASYIEDGIGQILRAINEANDGDIIVLSDGTFKANDNSGVEVSKSITIIGQGINTYIERTNDASDITIDYDGVSAIVKNLNVKHAVNVAPKDGISRFKSSVYIENVYIDGVISNAEEINYINNCGFATVGLSDSKYKYYATTLLNKDTAVPYINAMTYYTSKLPASENINERTILILPGEYIGIDGIEFNKIYPTKIIGLKGKEKETIISRTNGNPSIRQTIYCNPNTMNDAERAIENISFKGVVTFVNCSNFRMIGCYRNGIKLDDFYSINNYFDVGRNKIFAEVSHAVYVADFYKSDDNRCTIRVYGETRESKLVDINENIDIEGYDHARIMRIGQSLDPNSVDIYRAGYCLRLSKLFDGNMKNVDIILAGCQKGIDIPALKVEAEKARIENVRAYNLSFPSIPATINGDDILVMADVNNNIVRCVQDSESTTGYTAHVYSKVFGTEESTYECTSADASKTHDIHLTVRKPDSELSPNWEDNDGGRRHGIELYLKNDCDVILTNCEGYGSPWGFHNTRGIYVLGSPKLFNCIGVGGGIGHRLHGILCHDNSEAELVGCIGYASPFAYLTPSNFIQNGTNYNGENSVGIKFQRMSASKLTNCIGYGNDMPKGHGIHADMRTFPRLYNCEGYAGGGNGSSGLCIAEYATANVYGGYYGQHSRVYELPFKTNHGNGMLIYPYMRPQRKDMTENDVLYGNHWELSLENVSQAYCLENITFTRGKITTSGIGNKYLKFYDMDNQGNKTLISQEQIMNEDSDYQYVNINPYIINTGHKLYVCVEDNGSEVNVADGVLGITLGVHEVSTDSCGIYINQYWSHEATIDPSNPKYNVIYPAIISQVNVKSDDAIVIGNNANVAGKYNIANSTIDGNVVNQGDGDLRIYNSIKIVDDVVTPIN